MGLRATGTRRSPTVHSPGQGQGSGGPATYHVSLRTHQSVLATETGGGSGVQDTPSRPVVIAGRGALSFKTLVAYGEEN